MNGTLVQALLDMALDLLGEGGPFLCFASQDQCKELLAASKRRNLLTSPAPFEWYKPNKQQRGHYPRPGTNGESLFVANKRGKVYVHGARAKSDQIRDPIQQMGMFHSAKISHHADRPAEAFSRYEKPVAIAAYFITLYVRCQVYIGHACMTNKTFYFAGSPGLHHRRSFLRDRCSWRGRHAHRSGVHRVRRF